MEPALLSGTMLGMSQLVTGEAVPVELRLARIGSRVPATLLDFSIQLVLGVILAVALRPVLSWVDAALQAAIAERRPLSLIRLGDGERNEFAHLGRQTPFAERARKLHVAV